MKIPFLRGPHFEEGERVVYTFNKEGRQYEAQIHSGQVAIIAKIIPAQLTTHPYYQLKFSDGATVIAFRHEIRKA